MPFLYPPNFCRNHVNGLASPRGGAVLIAPQPQCSGIAGGPQSQYTALRYERLKFIRERPLAKIFANDLVSTAPNL